MDAKTIPQCLMHTKDLISILMKIHQVVVLSDGHSSRFDFAVLKFLCEKSIHSFITATETTGVTQLLDQSPNKKLYQEYSKKREELFMPFQTINREGFMNIFAQIWNVWAPKDIIVNAAQRVGI